MHVIFCLLLLSFFNITHSLGIFFIFYSQKLTLMNIIGIIGIIGDYWRFVYSLLSHVVVGRNHVELLNWGEIYLGRYKRILEGNRWGVWNLIYINVDSYRFYHMFNTTFIAYWNVLRIDSRKSAGLHSCRKPAATRNALLKRTYTVLWMWCDVLVSP